MQLSIAKAGPPLFDVRIYGNEPQRSNVPRNSRFERSNWKVLETTISFDRIAKNPYAKSQYVYIYMCIYLYRDYSMYVYIYIYVFLFFLFSWLAVTNEMISIKSPLLMASVAFLTRVRLSRDKQKGRMVAQRGREFRMVPASPSTNP